MSISTVYAPDEYVGDGVEDTFPITFNYLNDGANIGVTVGGVTKTNPTHFTVVAGNVVFGGAHIPADDAAIVIKLDLDFLQETEYTRNSVFPSSVLENDLDKLTLMVQYIDERGSNLSLVNVTDVTATAAEVNVLDGITSSTAELNILDGATLTVTELNYVDGVTSNIQTQLDGKSSTSHTHLLSAITDVTATATELNYVDGVTSAIQTQLDAKTTASSTSTLTNKTLDADGTGNVITNIGSSEIKSELITGQTLVTAAVGDHILVADASDSNNLKKVTVQTIVDLATPTLTLSYISDVTASAAEVNIMDGVTATTAELNILDGVTSSAAELNILDGATLTVTELNYVDGVTSAIQTQIDGKQASNTDLTDLAAQWFPANATTGANLHFHEGTDNGTNRVNVTAPASVAANCTVTLPSDTGTLALTSDISALSSVYQPLDAQLTDVAGLTPTDNAVIIGNGTNFVAESGATLKTSLGLTIGTDVQAYSANLAAVAAVTVTSAGTALLDDADASAQRTTLGLGTIATQAANSVNISGGAVTGITDITVADGGTGASDASGARTNLGLVIGTNVGAPPTSSTGLVITNTSSTTTIDLPGTSGGIGSIAGKNLLINGDFQIAQRLGGGGRGSASASTTIAVAASTTAYTVDRWQLKTGANQACTITQGGYGKLGYVCYIQRNNGQTGTGAIKFCQSLPMDRCYSLANQVVTLSFNAACNAGWTPTSGTLTCNIYTSTGTSDISGINGAFTGSVVQTTTKTITTTATNFSFTTTALQSGTRQVAVEFEFTPTGTAGAADWVYLRNVKLEVGSTPTPFVQTTYVEQLRDCQEFYYSTFPIGTAPAQSTGITSGCIIYGSQIAGTTAGWIQQFNYPVQMRTSPTITYYSPTSANGKWRNITASTDSGTASTSSASASGIAIYNPQVAGDAVAKGIGIHLAADAELV